MTTKTQTAKWPTVIAAALALALPSACAAGEPMTLDVTLHGLPASRPDPTTAILTYRATRCIWFISCETNWLGGSPHMKTYTRELTFVETGDSRTLNTEVKLKGGGLGAYVLESLRIQSDAEAKPSFSVRLPTEIDPALPAYDHQRSGHVLDSLVHEPLPQESWPQTLTLEIDHGPIYVASSSPAWVKDTHANKWGWTLAEDKSWVHTETGARRTQRPQAVTLPADVEVPIAYAFSIGSRYWSEPDRALLEASERFSVVVDSQTLDALGLTEGIQTSQPFYVPAAKLGALRSAPQHPGIKVRLEPEQAIWVKLAEGTINKGFLVTGGLAPGARWMAVDVVELGQQVPQIPI